MLLAPHVTYNPCQLQFLVSLDLFWAFTSGPSLLLDFFILLLAFMMINLNFYLCYQLPVSATTSCAI